MGKPVDVSAISDWSGYLAACAKGGACTKCDGKGRTEYKGEHLKVFNGRPCCFCDGKGTFAGFDPLAVVRECFVQNKKTGKIQRFRRAPPADFRGRKAGSIGARSYYVWRLARFHGGADVTMPMEAMSCVEGDPLAALLDPLACAVAKIVFGNDKTAAYRWGRLLIDPTLPEMPEGCALSASSHHPAVLLPELDREPA